MYFYGLPAELPTGGAPADDLFGGMQIIFINALLFLVVCVSQLTTGGLA